MGIVVYYKNYKIGELNFDGKNYIYNSLKDCDKFLNEYGFIDYQLAKVKSKTFKIMPYFFAEFVEQLIHNNMMSTKLNINLTKDNYFDILSRYAKLPQTHTGFHFMLE